MRYMRQLIFAKYLKAANPIIEVFPSFSANRETFIHMASFEPGECGGIVVEPRTRERKVGGSIPTTAVLCP